MQGNSEYSFAPKASITIAESIAIASRIHNIYCGNGFSFKQNTALWYQSYVDYAIDNGIISATQYSDYSVSATRAQFTTILSKSLPQKELSAINNVTNIPDLG